MADKRLIKLLSTRGDEIKGESMLDTYNQQIQEEVSCTIRTNINTANHHFIMEEKIIKEDNYSPSVQKDSMVAEPRVKKIGSTDLEIQGDYETYSCVTTPKEIALHIPEATAQGYAKAYDGDSVNLSQPNSKTRRGRVGRQMANTLDTGCQQGVVEKDENIRYRIRKLTPRECFRLMGVDDADIDKLQTSGISNSQLYKCAGNSIVVDVLYHLFRKMFVETENENQQLTLF